MIKLKKHLFSVPGVIGVLQALETIKIITQQPDVLSGRLLTFDGSNTTFRNIKLRTRSLQCSICGEIPTITRYIDYEQFCGAGAHDKVTGINIVADDEKIAPKDLLSSNEEPRVLIDVRPTLEYEMCHLPDSVNIPYEELLKKEERLDDIKKIINCNDKGK